MERIESIGSVGRERGVRGPEVSFGRELQLERQRRKITLEAIAEGTKVPTRHLRALEQEEFEQLPGGVFNKGIVRSYCRHLGLDEQEWLDKFPTVLPDQAEPDWASFAENVRRNRTKNRTQTGLRWFGVLAMLRVLGVLGWAAWKFVLQPRVQVLPQAGQVREQTTPVSGTN
jgi:cytoskeleton protein RodZ